VISRWKAVQERPTRRKAARVHGCKPRCTQGAETALHSAPAMGAYGIAPILGGESPDLTLVQGESFTLPAATRSARCSPGYKPGMQPVARKADSRAMSQSADPSAGRVELWA